MNKLLTDYNRGFKLKTNDLRFVDNAVRLALTDLAKTFGSTACVLYGCGITQHTGYASVSEGALLYDNEIWHVYPHNFAVGEYSDGLYWHFIVDYDPFGAKLDKDLQNHQTYQVRRASISYDLTMPNAVSIEADAISADISTLYFGYQNTSMSLANGIIGLAQARRMAQTVILSGNVQAVFGATPTLVLTSPLEYRPAIALSGIIRGIINADAAKIQMGYELQTSGRLYVWKEWGGSEAAITAYITIPAYWVG